MEIDLNGNCNIHGPYKTQPITILGKVIGWTGCPECAEKEEVEEKAAEEKEAQKKKIESYKNRGIEPEFYNATLENYKPETISEKQALEAANELRDGQIHKLLLLGSNGTGKTHLACALAKELKGVRITMFELSARIRAGYNEKYGEMAILNELLQYPLIIIDEVGRTKGSDAEKNWMSYLVDKAHTRHVRLMMISNRISAKNLPQERRGEAFEYYFDNDVISRLRQDSKIVEVKGRDRRGTPKMENSKTAESAV